MELGKTPEKERLAWRAGRPHQCTNMDPLAKELYLMCFRPCVVKCCKHYRPQETR